MTMQINYKRFYYQYDFDTRPKLMEDHYNAWKQKNEKTNKRFVLPQFEVLNELKSDNRRTDNCAQLRRFVFECDEASYAWQLHNANKHDDVICRATFSGGKSIHCIIELSDDAKSIQEYKLIWQFLNNKYFDSKADTACCDPVRLTRTPYAMRKLSKNGVDSWVQQRLIFSNDNILNKFTYDAVELNKQSEILAASNKFISKHSINVDELSTEYAKFVAAKEQEQAKYAAYVQPTIADQLLNQHKCKSWNVVSRYLNTPFPQISGNGHSSKWLFAAVKTCQRYADTATLDEVLAKARLEKWTEQELQRILNAKVH